ncbi:MAG TPA: hypothetical protein VFQ53_25120 [Kofleriaceae bacterium]|nr:hypothetical protein [Kofleriaceae bacterium]
MKRLVPLTLVIAACSSDAAPDRPSWQVDVMPLFAANCVRCHAYPFRGDGATALRLDSFDDTELADGNVASGASKSVQAIFRHTHDIALLPGQRVMPPDRPLDDYELAVIRNWASLGNGETAVRGPGHPDNHAPELALTELARDATSITFGYELRDADRDLVVGTVIGPRFDGTMLDPMAVVGNVTAGRDQFTWDITGVTPGDYPIRARLDDGADVDPEGSADFVEVDLGLVTIP